MVINKFGEHLYTGLIRVMTRHLSKAADHIEVLQGEAFLKEMKARWDHHTRSMSMIRDILMVRWPSHRSWARNSPFCASESFEA